MSGHIQFCQVQNTEHSFTLSETEHLCVHDIRISHLMIKPRYFNPELHEHEDYVMVKQRLTLIPMTIMHYMLKMKEKGHLEDLSVDGRQLLEWNLRQIRWEGVD
jgi:hypothetical protein